MHNKYLIVDKNIVPDYFEKVIEARDLIKSGRCTNVSEAVKIVGISRSTYYKYKDSVFLPSDNDIGKKALISVMLEDKSGALSEVLNLISSCECNIITINQNIPINGVASVVISLDVSKATSHIEDILEKIETSQFILSSRLIAVG